MEKVKNTLIRFPEMPMHLIKTKRSRFFVALSVFFFVWFFLFTFGVFNFNQFEFEERLIRSLVYSFACFISLLINFLIIQDFVLKKMTFKNIAFWSLWLTVCVGSSNFLITTLVYQSYAFSLSNFLVNLSYVFSLYLLIFPTVLLVNYLFHLRLQLQKATERSEKIKYHTSHSGNDKSIQIRSKYKSDHLELSIDQLLFISSAGNYVEVFSLNGEIVNQQMIRTTLTYIEKQKLHPALVRTHRGYIVNINQMETIKKIDGNDFLILKKANQKVPVSKNYKPLIKELIESR